MNNIELDNLIRKIILEILDNKDKNNSFPKLYIFMPNDFDEFSSDELISFFKNLEKKYKLLFINSESKSQEISRIAGNNLVINRSDLKTLDRNGFVLFLDLSLSLLSKCALLISDDYESKWIIEAIKNGNKIFIREKEILYTEVSPISFKNRIENYKDILKQYGIDFNWKNLIKENNKLDYNYKKNEKKLITATSIDKMQVNSNIIINKGDIVTLLAQERAEEKGITFDYQQGENQ